MEGRGGGSAGLMYPVSFPDRTGFISQWVQGGGFWRKGKGVDLAKGVFAGSGHEQSGAFTSILIDTNRVSLRLTGRRDFKVVCA
jgi:hypothetical protein